MFLNLNKPIDKKYIYAFLRIVFLLLAAAFVWYFLKKYLFPFAMAFLLAFLLQPVARLVCKGTRMSKKLVSLILILTFFVLVITLAVYAVTRLYTESIEIAETLAENAGNITASIRRAIEKIRSYIILYNDENGEYLFSLIESYVKEALGKLSSYAASSAASFVYRLPSLFISFIMFFFASLYICADFDKISHYLISLLPKNKAHKIIRVKNSLVNSSLKIARAYLIMLLITFAELFLAFALLKIKYAFTIAAIISLLDMLPAIGVGFVLIPWALFELWNKNKMLAFSLIAIYVIVTVFRELLEPRIMGASLGIHPLASLVSVYVGIKLFGFWGIIVAPLVTSAAKNILDNIKSDNSA